MGQEYDDESGVFDVYGIDTLSSEERAKIVAGRYQITERLGTGGVGQVYKVLHLGLGKHFALKLMQAETLLDADAQRTFVREARLASQLSHPNIVSIADFGHDADWGLYLVMEYLEGETLAQRIKQHGPLPVKVACDVLSQLAAAVEHSHAQRVIHADIKPDNVVCLTPTGKERRHWTVKLLDYGMARVANPSGGRQASIGGTPEYMAPEQAIGEPPGEPGDVYALGMVMYEMLTGAPPFEGGTAQEILERQVREQPATLAERMPEPPPEVIDAIVTRAIAKAPRNRYPDAASLRRDLLEFMAGSGLHNRVQSSPAPNDRVIAAAAIFDRLRIPCGSIAADGSILIGNQALAKMLKIALDDLEKHNILLTPLAALHPTLSDDLHLVTGGGKTVARRIQAGLKGDKPRMLRLLLTPGFGAAGECVLTIHPLDAPSS